MKILRAEMAHAGGVTGLRVLLRFFFLSFVLADAITNFLNPKTAKAWCRGSLSALCELTNGAAEEFL